MKKLWGVIIVSLTAALMLPLTSVSAVDVNNFYISSYDIRYQLSRDGEGHSLLTTTETITAEFPSSNQNHGIERALPSTYEKRTTNLKVISVTDADGVRLPYSKKTNAQGVAILRIGDADTYVHGTQTYRIVYIQQDVTRTFADTDRDEWYWDTNGTEWRVPIQKLTVSVMLDDDLEPARSGAPYCYQGRAGSTRQCSVDRTETGAYEAEVLGMAAGENVTLAIGFTKGTFVQYQPSLWDTLLTIWKYVLAAGVFVGFGAIIALSIAYGRKRNRQSELHTIPVEYIPPKDASVLISAQVVVPKGSAFSAQLIDLAVRHKLAIIETKAKGMWSAARYNIKILSDVSSLRAEEREILEDMFGYLPEVGEQLSLNSLRSNMSYFTRTSDNDRKIKVLVDTTYALREKHKPTSRFFYNWAIVLGVIGVLTLALPVIVIAGIVAVLGATIRPLTDKGLELRRYLLGLDKYIHASEEERLKLFQGPDTAEKVGEVVDVTDTAQILKLYERVLPYAILFGREKEWTKRLGEFYDSTHTSPDWYSGTAAFNVAMFSSAISSFSSAASYSGGSSSSSGGSSGGGSSGGGGGGGGGGGW